MLTSVEVYSHQAIRSGDCGRVSKVSSFTLGHLKMAPCGPYILPNTVYCYVIAEKKICKYIRII